MLEGQPPDTKRRKLAKGDGLKKSLQSGDYPEFTGPSCGVTKDYELDPSDSCLEFTKLLWPDVLCEHIAVETNRYARTLGTKRWVDTDKDEIWVFLGIVVLMGIHRLPCIDDYWSKDPLLGVQPVQAAMSLARFRALWANLHCEDNSLIVDRDDVSCKIQTVVRTLSSKFREAYNPSQNLSVDEMMVKYKGRKGGKIHMKNKPIKLGFKVWSCSCSCCGYLCSFQLYSGRRKDPLTGKKVSEPGLINRVVTDLLEGFSGNNHVVYMDNYFTSGPLIECLAEKKIYVAGTIKQSASGFPQELKVPTPPKGQYRAKTVGDIRYFVFNDHKVCSFATNTFPEQMPEKVFRVQGDGRLHAQSVPPLLPAYNSYMGGVDTTGHLRKTYGYDRKSKRYWLRLFFQFLDLAINNAYILYKHNCARVHRGTAGTSTTTTKVKTLKDFRLGITRHLVEAPTRRYTRQRHTGHPCSSPCIRVPVRDVGVNRGRCEVCVKEKLEPHHWTQLACRICGIRLCKTHEQEHSEIHN